VRRDMDQARSVTATFRSPRPPSRSLCEPRRAQRWAPPSPSRLASQGPPRSCKWLLTHGLPPGRRTPPSAPGRLLHHPGPPGRPAWPGATRWASGPGVVAIPPMPPRATPRPCSPTPSPARSAHHHGPECEPGSPQSGGDGPVPHCHRHRGTSPQQCKWLLTTDPTWATYTTLPHLDGLYHPAPGPPRSPGPTSSASGPEQREHRRLPRGAAVLAYTITGPSRPPSRA